MSAYLTALVNIIVGRVETKSEKGATMVEYGLLVAVIALVVIVGAAVFGSSLSAAFSGWAAKL